MAHLNPERPKTMMPQSFIRATISRLCPMIRWRIVLHGIRAFLLHPTAFGDWVRHAFFVVTHSS
jgi:hypothetical protein